MVSYTMTVFRLMPHGGHVKEFAIAYPPGIVPVVPRVGEGLGNSVVEAVRHDFTNNGATVVHHIEILKRG